SGEATLAIDPSSYATIITANDRVAPSVELEIAPAGMRLDGSSFIGRQNTGRVGDNMTIDLRGTPTNGSMTIRGLSATGTFADDVLLINGTDVVRRRSLADLIGAEWGITYNEASNGRMRLGSSTKGSAAANSVLGADRFINQGGNGIEFTWLNGATTSTMLALKNGVVDIDGALTVRGTTNVNTTTTSATSIGNATGALTLTGSAIGVNGATTLTGSLTQSAGQVTLNGNVDAKSGLDVIGATTMSGSLSQSNGAVLLDVSGAGNSLTVGGLPAGSVTGATPDDVMLITTTTNVVRRRSFADVIGAEQGLSYNETNTDGKLRLGANANNKQLFQSDRFINQRNFALNFTYTDGVAAPLSMLSLDEGNIAINGVTTVRGTTNINSVAGAGATAVGNTSNNLNLTGTAINMNGTINHSNGAVTSNVGANAFTVNANGGNTTLIVNNATGGVQASAISGAASGDVFIDPGTVSIDGTADVLINSDNTVSGSTTVGNTAKV
ncbi:MAG: hypothetical protein ACK475_10245, partial [Bacteroidota bacterium]